jgi:hypothetical protein
VVGSVLAGAVGTAAAAAAGWEPENHKGRSSTNCCWGSCGPVYAGSLAAVSCWSRPVACGGQQHIKSAHEVGCTRTSQPASSSAFQKVT